MQIAHFYKNRQMSKRKTQKSCFFFGRSQNQTLFDVFKMTKKKKRKKTFFFVVFWKDKKKMTTQFFYVKPVSAQTFAFVELDGPPPTGKVQGQHPAQNIAHLSYNGLYKFLFIVRKMDPKQLGTVKNEWLSLPVIDLTKGPKPPAEFIAQNPEPALRKTLTNFLARWFTMSIEGQQSTKIDPSVGQQYWENVNTVKPKLASFLQQGTTGPRLVTFDEQEKQQKTIADLILDVQALNKSLEDCITNSNPTACAAAKATGETLQNNINLLS